jgi:cobyrinic acid a,c-diamide synthase
VLGALRRDGAVGAPSRHLGLVPVAERRAEAVESVRALAARVRAGCDLEGLLALARSAPPLAAEPWDPAVAVASNTGRAVVAIAGGSAFTFAYAEHAELLAAAGAEVVTFDPLHDEALPPGTAGIVIGGGFPEVYAPELSANEPLRKAVAAFNGPIAAECAGLLYLSRELDGKPMCGVLDATARMSDRLTLGYREAVAVSDSVLAVAGTRVRGHEFHRTVVEPGAGGGPERRTESGAADRSKRSAREDGTRNGAQPGAGTAAAWGMTRPARRLEGFVQEGVHASYLHVHWAAEPSLARRFVERCEEV